MADPAMYPLRGPKNYAQRMETPKKKLFRFNHESIEFIANEFLIDTGERRAEIDKQSN